MPSSSLLPRPPRSDRGAQWDPRWVWLAAGIAGVVASLGFAPFAVPIATLLGMSLLITVLRHEVTSGWGIRSALVVALAFGFGFTAVLLWWMRVVSPGAYIALAIAQAVLTAASVLAIRVVIALPGWPVWSAAVWTMSEYLRGAFPFGGFPWGRLAHATLGSPVEAWVRVIGMAATSTLVFLLAAGLAHLVSKPRASEVAAVLVGAGMTVGLGVVLPTGAASPVGSTFVAVVQGDVPVLFASWPSREIFAKHVAATRDLVAAVDAGDVPQPDMVLWPENSLDFDPLNDPPAASQLTDLTRSLNSPILIGAILDGPTAETATNTGIVWTENGPADRYTKRKLVPFGEYVPFRDTLESLVPRFGREIPRDMLPGPEQGPVHIAGVTVGDAICWDVAHDAIVADTVRGGAQMLVVQTSNASFTGTSQPEQQWQISRLRAIETGRSVVVPSTNGISGIIDASGNVVERAPTRVSTFVSAKIELADGITPGVRWGANLQLGIILLGGAGLLLAARKTWRSQIT